MANLLRETTEHIDHLRKVTSDVVFIGSSDGKYSITWEHFKLIADIEYDSGFGSAEIAEDLVIVFNDNTWLSRGSYQGSERWVLKTPPKQNESHETFNNLRAKRGWETISEIMNPEINGY